MYVDRAGRRRMRKARPTVAARPTRSWVSGAIKPGGATVAEEAGAETPAGKKLSKKFESGMFLFFDKRAMRAKWTKDIYEFLKGGKREKQGGFFDFLGNLLKLKLVTALGGFFAMLGAGIGKVLAFILSPFKFIITKLVALGPMLLNVVAVLGSFVAGLMAGRWLRKLFPQIDEFLSGPKGIFTKLYQWMYDNFSGFFSWIGDMGSAAFDWIKGLPDMLGSFGAWIDEQLGGVPSMLLDAAGFVAGKIRDAGAFVWDLFVKLIRKIPGVSFLIDKTKELGGQAFDAAKGIAKPVGDAMKKGWNALSGFLDKNFGLGSFASSDQVEKAITGSPTEPAMRVTTVGGKQPELPAVPVVVQDGGASGLQEFSATLTKDINSLMDELKKSQKSSLPVGRGSDVDVYNVRDPLLETMNMGALAVED